MATIILHKSVFRVIAVRRKIFVRVADSAGILVEVTRQAAERMFELADASGHVVLYEKRRQRRLVLSIKMEGKVK